MSATINYEGFAFSLTVVAGTLVSALPSGVIPKEYFLVDAMNSLMLPHNALQAGIVYTVKRGMCKL